MDGVECVLTQASIEAMQRKELLKDWPADFQSAQLPIFSLAVDKPRIAPKAPKPPKAPTLPKALKIGAMTAKMKKSAMMKKKAIAVATASAIVPSDASVMATASAIVPSDASVSSGHASMATASAIVPSDVSVILGLPPIPSDTLPGSFRAHKEGYKLMQRSLIDLMGLYREAFPSHNIIDVNGMIAVPNDRNEIVSWLDMVKRVPQHFIAEFRLVKNRDLWAQKVYHKLKSIKADLTRETNPTPNTFRELMKQIPESTVGNIFGGTAIPPPPPPPPPPSPPAPPPPPHAS